MYGHCVGYFIFELFRTVLQIIIILKWQNCGSLMVTVLLRSLYSYRYKINIQGCLILSPFSLSYSKPCLSSQPEEEGIWLPQMVLKVPAPPQDQAFCWLIIILKMKVSICPSGATEKIFLHVLFLNGSTAVNNVYDMTQICPH